MPDPTGPSNHQPVCGLYSGSVTAVVKATRGSVFGFHAINKNGATRYLQIFNQSAGAPSGSTNLVAEFLIEAGKGLTLGAEVFTNNGLACTSGIVFGFSTGTGSYTAATAADHSLTIATK